jgi:hypothetical protein
MADSQGNVPPEGTQGDPNTPKVVTEDQLNRAITARLTAFAKAQEKSMTEFSASLMGKLEELVKTSAPVPPAGDPKPPGDSPELKGALKRLAELEQTNKQIQAERDAERGRARDAHLRQQLSDALVKHGVDATRVRHAVGILIDSEKRVRFDDDGESVVFKDPTDNQDVDLLTGVRSWVKSDDGKFYLPPRGVNGSGDRGAGKALQTKQQTGPIPSAADIGELFLKEYT